MKIRPLPIMDGYVIDVKIIPHAQLCMSGHIANLPPESDCALCVSSFGSTGGIAIVSGEVNSDNDSAVVNSCQMPLNRLSS